MSKLLFVTGNRHKVAELRAVLPGLSQAELDLPEIQAVDSREVIGAKLIVARKHFPEGAILVEDTALHLGCLNGFPGALIKWLLASVGCEGIFEVCNRMGNLQARACTVLGCLPEDSDRPLFFEGVLDGVICFPSGRNGFGWDPVFKPNGFDKTLGEMDQMEKQSVSMRKIAAEKLAFQLAANGPG